MPNSQQGANGAEAGPSTNSSDEGWDDADGPPPDITSLTPEERVTCCCLCSRMSRLVPSIQTPSWAPEAIMGTRSNHMEQACGCT